MIASPPKINRKNELSPSKINSNSNSPSIICAFVLISTGGGGDKWH